MAESKSTPAKDSKENQQLSEKEAAAKAKALKKSKETPVDDHTKDTYVPEPGTEGNYHAKIEKRSFDQHTGKKKSSAQIQIFGPKAFQNFERASASLGYTVEILHDPTGEYPLAGIAKLKAEAKKAEKK